METAILIVSLKLKMDDEEAILRMVAFGYTTANAEARKFH
jgi:hypothetical protein